MTVAFYNFCLAASFLIYTNIDLSALSSSFFFEKVVIEERRMNTNSTFSEEDKKELKASFCT